MKGTIDKLYINGGFELRWREGPLHRFRGVTWNESFEGHQNDAAHYDDGYGAWPFPDPPQDVHMPQSWVEDFGMLNAWMLAWWPPLSALRLLPHPDSTANLPSLAGPWRGLIPMPDGPVRGALRIEIIPYRLLLHFRLDDGRSFDVHASTVAWFPSLDYVELRLQLPGGPQDYWMLDLRCNDGSGDREVLTAQPALHPDLRGERG